MFRVEPASQRLAGAAAVAISRRPIILAETKIMDDDFALITTVTVTAGRFCVGQDYNILSFYPNTKYKIKPLTV